MRLNKYIAQSGYCSRRQADELIRKGKVFVNDRLVKEMGIQVDLSMDAVRIKGGPTLKASKKKILLMLHKPKGYVCTRRDPYANKTVYELLPKQYHHLNSIGRLDKDSEGLLLFTNDGDLANQLTHPKYEKAKVYRITIRGKLSEDALRRLKKGMRLREYRVQPVQVKIISHDSEQDTSIYELTLKEGKKRQIRNMFLVLKQPVKRLVRIRFGPYALGRLKIGEWKII